MTANLSPGWRVGDAGKTVFGPKNGDKLPEIIAQCKNGSHSRQIVRAVNCYDELLEACIAAFKRFNAMRFDTAAYDDIVTTLERAIAKAVKL